MTLCLDRRHRPAGGDRPGRRDPARWRPERSQEGDARRSRRWFPWREAASKDLDAVELLNTTQTQVNQTVGVVANYGGSLDVILEDAEG